jgi:hypothetical protein
LNETRVNNIEVTIKMFQAEVDIVDFAPGRVMKSQLKSSLLTLHSHLQFGGMLLRTNSEYDKLTRLF